MQTLKEPQNGRRGRMTISDPNYETTKRKKKQLKDFTLAEVSSYRISTINYYFA